MIVIPRIIGAKNLVYGYYLSQITKNALTFPQWLEKILNFDPKRIFKYSYKSSGKYLKSKIEMKIK